MSRNDSSGGPPPYQGGQPQQGGPADQEPQYSGFPAGGPPQPQPGASGYFPQDRKSDHQDPSAQQQPQQPQYPGGPAPGAQGQFHPSPTPSNPGQYSTSSSYATPTDYGQKQPGLQDRAAMTQGGGPPQPRPVDSSAENHHQGGPGGYPPTRGDNAPYGGQHGPPSGPGAYADGSDKQGGQTGQKGERGLKSKIVGGVGGAIVGNALFGGVGAIVGAALGAKAMKKKH